MNPFIQRERRPQKHASQFQSLYSLWQPHPPYSTNIKRGKKYNISKYQYLSNANFSSQLDSLDETWNPTLAKALDMDFQRPCKSAATQCKHRPQMAHTQQLADLHLEKNVLQQSISSVHTEHSYSNSITYTTRKGNQFTILPTLDTCNQQCQDIKNIFCNQEKHHIHYRSTEQEKLLQGA